MRQVLEGGEKFKMDTYLSHHGILGQKWGVRRYQNEDGSLTEAGRRRYDVGSARLTKREAKAAAKATVKAAKKEAKQIVKDRKLNREENNDMAKKKVSQLSDDELAERIARLRQEKDYYSLQSDIAKLQPKQVNEGKELVKKFLKDTVEPAAANASRAFLEKKLKEKLGITDSVDPYKKMADEIKNWNTEKAYKKMQEEKKGSTSESEAKTSDSAKSESSITSERQSPKNEKQSKRDSDDFRKEFDKAYKEAEDAINRTQKEANKSNSQTKNESEPIDYSKYKVKKPTDIIDADFYDVPSDNLPAVTNTSRDYVSGWSNKPISGLLSASTEQKKRKS